MFQCITDISMPVRNVINVCRTDKQIANRRRFLATVAGTTIAVAGCSGGQNTDTPANSSSNSSTDSSPDSTTEELPDPDGSRNTGAVNGIERAYGIPNTVPIGIDGDRVITRDNVDGEPAFVGFNYLTGERLWTRSIESYDTPAISASGQIGHGRLYSIGSEGDEDKYINVIDVTSGELLNNIEFDLVVVRDRDDAARDDRLEVIVRLREILEHYLRVHTPDLSTGSVVALGVFDKLNGAGVVLTESYSDQIPNLVGGVTDQKHVVAAVVESIEQRTQVVSLEPHQDTSVKSINSIDGRGMIGYSSPKYSPGTWT